jgi:hypothetical protein
MDKIGDEIDFCLIDTAHYNPGEILDVLMVLPFLREGAVIIFHDVKYHTMLRTQKGITNNLLMSSVAGKKLLQGNAEKVFPNIAGIKTDKNTKENIFEIFNLLTIKWGYIPSESQCLEMIDYLKRYYDAYYINYIKAVFEYQKKLIDDEEKKHKIKYTIKKILGKENVKRIKNYREKMKTKYNGT